ncbi:MAG: hypothetical protein ACRDNW_08315, partial [Trebonia sp.]
MADISYVPGLLTAVVGESCWVLVEASPDSPVVTRIWQQFAQGAAADALLVGMLADGIGGTSGFALLTAGTDGRHRVYCRGAVCATVVTAAASDQIDGAELLTWREHVITGAGRVFLGQPPADAALRLPAASGVLLAGCVVVDFTTVTFLPDIPDTITVQPPGGDVSQAPNPVDTGQARPPGQERPGEYDFFWGATQMRTVEDAAVRGPDDGGPLPGAPGGLIDVPQWLADPGDSGSTVKRGDLPEPVAGTAPPDRIGPVVPALVCQNGHLNPPSGAACRRCGG